MQQLEAADPNIDYLLVTNCKTMIKVRQFRVDDLLFKPKTMATIISFGLFRVFFDKKIVSSSFVRSLEPGQVFFS